MELASPDYVYRIPSCSWCVEHGIVDYQFFTVKLDFPEERWFSAVEVKPGNSSVVHHIGLHLVKSEKKGIQGFRRDGGPIWHERESAKLINDYVPGDYYNAKIYPGHQAVRIPKGS